MKDIARASGVSRPMVSLVLNGRAGELRVAEATRQRVLETAEKLGYCRNQLALSVVTGRSRTLAFVTAEMGVHNYTGRIQKGMLDAAAEHDYATKLYHLNGDDAKLVRSLREWQVSGVIFHVADYQRIAAIHRELEEQGIPMAVVNLRNRGMTGFGITTDDEDGAYQATAHLIAQGAGKIGCVFTDTDCEYVAARRNGYRKAMEENKLKPLWLKTESDGYREIYEGLSSKAGKSMDALFCIDDSQAMAAMRAAFRLGIAIPERLKLAGYGDLDMGSHAPISLTSVHQEYETMGQEAALAVIRAVENDDDEIRKTIVNKKLPIELIIRESSTKLNS